MMLGITYKKNIVKLLDKRRIFGRPKVFEYFNENMIRIYELLVGI
jgi:hypothetical protein